MQRLVLKALAMAHLASSAAAQEAPPRADSAPMPPLFQRAEPLHATFTANLGRLRRDRGENAPWRSASLLASTDTGRVAVPLLARTRGIYRLKHCDFPPLRLDFPGKGMKGTMFRQLGKPKLVNHCRDTDTYDQYILQELQLYRAYQLLTPVSYRVRIMRVAYVDSASGRTEATRYAIITEDPDGLARRLGGMVVKSHGAQAHDLAAEPLALAYLFEYMIGNSDFSFNRLHNTNLIGTPDGRLLPVVYDFDFSGVVNASYAIPNPQLGIRHARERKFWGSCTLATEYVRLLPLFREKKEAIYALWRDEVGRLIEPSRVRETLEYFDQFYEMIATPESAHRAFLRTCVRPG